MLKSSPNRQSEYIQLTLPIFFYPWLSSSRSYRMSISVDEVKKEFDKIKLGNATNVDITYLEQRIIDQLTSDNSLMTGHHMKVFKFLDSIKYVLSKHTGGDRKLKALCDDVKRVVNETFGDY